MKTQQPDLDRLVVWALATFHASLFMLVALLFLHWQDVLRNILPTLNTAVGLGLFVLLWAITWWTTRRAVAVMEDDSDIVRRAARWGGVNGVLFLAIAIALGAVGLAVTEPSARSFQLLGGVAFFLTVGSLFAFAIGAVVGSVLGLIDLALLRVARGLAFGATGPRLTNEMRPDGPPE